MTMVVVGYFAVVALLALLAVGVPIAWGMGVVGVVGHLYVTGFTRTAS